MMKTKIKYYLILLSFSPLLLFTSCIEEFEADIPAEDTDLLVVEGTIYSGKMSSFILSRTQSVKSSDTPRMEWGAMVDAQSSFWKHQYEKLGVAALCEQRWQGTLFCLAPLGQCRHLL